MKTFPNTRVTFYVLRILIICFFIILTILLKTPGITAAAENPLTVGEIALYVGPDRENILIKGAKKEGQLVFYNSNTWMNNVISREFEKKYPFIKVQALRSGSEKLIKRIMEEYAAQHYIADVMESRVGYIRILHSKGILQEYFSPELAYYSKEGKESGKTGAYYCGDRASYVGLGFNTQTISPSEAPKAYPDLLDSKWRGKISIVGSATGIIWMGNCQDILGQDFIEKLIHQNVKVQNISSAAMATLVVAGEAPLSPTIIAANAFVAKRNGAPIEWRPLEPVIANLGSLAMTTHTRHPHAAMLFIDYILSKEGQLLMMKGGLGSPRKGINSPFGNFKTIHMEAKYSLKEWMEKYVEWEALVRRLYIK